MAHRPKRGHDFTDVGTLIQAVAGRLLDQPRSKGQRLQRQWRQAVGDKVAQHSKPVRLANGVLTVKVGSPIWYHELHHLQTELLAKLQDTLPPDTLHTIRFKQGSLDTLPDWLKPKPPPPSPPPPCQEDVRRAHALVASVEDADVREELRRLLLAHMTRIRSES